MLTGQASVHPHLCTSTFRIFQGASRFSAQPPAAARVYSKRSCSRFARPCQNSTVSGRTRKATPKRWQGHFAIVFAKPRPDLCQVRLQCLARCHRLALSTGPRRQPALTRTRCKIPRGLVVADPFDASGHEHLPLQRQPRKQERRHRVFLQRSAFAALEIRVEYETCVAQSLEQHRPHARGRRCFPPWPNSWRLVRRLWRRSRRSSRD